MTWVDATPRVAAQLAQRHLGLFIVASILLWTLLSPLALLRWYPADWRTRYGEEMTALLHDTIAEGRGGPLLSLNIVREGLAARLAPPERRQALAWICLGLCAIPLIPQGLVPAIMILTDTPARSWFLALYLPEVSAYYLMCRLEYGLTCRSRRGDHGMGSPPVTRVSRSFSR